MITEGRTERWAFIYDKLQTQPNAPLRRLFESCVEIFREASTTDQNRVIRWLGAHPLAEYLRSAKSSAESEGKTGRRVPNPGQLSIFDGNSLDRSPTTGQHGVRSVTGPKPVKM